MRSLLLQFVEDFGKSALEVFVVIHRTKGEESTNNLCFVSLVFPRSLFFETNERIRQGSVRFILQ